MATDEAKRRSVYNNPINHLQRDAEAKRDAEARRIEPLRARHRKETDEMQSAHRTASEKLRHEHEVERNYHSQFPSQPAGLDAKHKTAREKLTKKHEAERDKLKHRHEGELAKAKKMPPEAKIHA